MSPGLGGEAAPAARAEPLTRPLYCSSAARAGPNTFGPLGRPCTGRRTAESAGFNLFARIDLRASQCGAQNAEQRGHREPFVTSELPNPLVDLHRAAGAEFQSY